MTAVRLIAWLLGLFFLLVLLVLPLLTAMLVSLDQLPPSYSRYLTAIERIQTWSMKVFTIGWFFFVGGCFASFLNVVAWRIPRGRSILGSSYCPNCRTRLAFGDNLPIVGWLRNCGRCSVCQSSIAVRYLIAEIVLGTVFLFIAWTEFAGGGWNLPFRPVDRLVGFENLLYDPQWDLIRLFVYHLVLLSTLFMFALIEADRFWLPWTVVWFPALIGVGLPMVWSDTLLVSWNGQYAAESLTQFGIDKWLTLLIGAGIGFFVGWWWQFIFDRPTKRNGLNAAVGLMTVGLFLGWQAVLSVALIAILLCQIGRFLNSRNTDSPLPLADQPRYWNTSALWLVATIMQLLTWSIQVGGWQFIARSLTQNGV